MMKNRIGLIAAWLLATALAVGVASQAVGLVADRAVEVPVQVPVALADQSSQGPTTAPPGDPIPPTTVPATTTTIPSSSGSTSSAPGSSVATTTTIAATTTSVPSPTTTTSTTTTTTSPPSLDSGTFFVTGGQVSAACTGPDTIEFAGAIPLSGWKLEIDSRGPSKVRVDFEAGEDETEVEIVCVNGQLLTDISD